MNILNTEFRRLFSLNFYKEKRLMLSKSSFEKDFINTQRGDLYPLVEKSADANEMCSGGIYRVEKGRVSRFFTRFFPYASFELTASPGRSGRAGLIFKTASACAELSFGESEAVFSSDGRKESFCCGFGKENVCVIVSLRPGAFDLYLKADGAISHLTSFAAAGFSDSDLYDEFKNGSVLFTAENGAAVKSLLSFIDSGISIADIRPVRYEDLEIMREGGRIFLTASIRLQSGCMQGVFSWVPGTAEFSLEGAIFYNAGTRRWCSDVAASMLYNRKINKWQLWVCSFGNGHILGFAEFDGDIRFGVNLLDITLMKKADEESSRELFEGFKGDEDPDFFYDEERGKWMMAICRLDPESKGYRYYFFESEKPFEGYKFIGKGNRGAETGGSFVKIGGELYFVCGNDFKKRANYRIYHKDGVADARFDLDDGGFRGWGSVIPIKYGSRERYFWLTFDRHCGSDYNWSYGNLYCFEAPME